MTNEEFDRCTQEAAFLEAILSKDPSQTHLWVLRSEIYQHLNSKPPVEGYTTEQLFFGPFVAGKSKEETIKDAYSYSFLNLKHYNKLKEIATELENDTDT